MGNYSVNLNLVEVTETRRGERRYSLGVSQKPFMHLIAPNVPPRLHFLTVCSTTHANYSAHIHKN